MRYLLLIYGDRDHNPSPEEQGQIFQAYTAFTRDIQERGLMRAGEALETVETAKTIRVRNGERLVSDGPFAETKEQLGGFYSIECDTLDEAIETAARIPVAGHGSVEVRPIMELPNA